MTFKLMALAQTTLGTCFRADLKPSLSDVGEKPISPLYTMVKYETQSYLTTLFFFLSFLLFFGLLIQKVYMRQLYAHHWVISSLFFQVS